MHFSHLTLLSALALSAPILAAPTPSPKPFSNTTAFLQLDLINAEVSGATSTGSAGHTWAANMASWTKCIHSQADPLLQIFTRLSFKPGHPEVGANAPIAPIAQGLFSGGELTGLDERFEVDVHGFERGTSRDVVLPKTRYGAAAGSLLVEVLRNQGVETVVLSGLRTSAAVIATAFSLFDEDFRVVVVRDTVFELPVGQTEMDLKRAKLAQHAILDAILPNMPVDVISLDEAKRLMPTKC